MDCRDAIHNNDIKNLKTGRVKKVVGQYVQTSTPTNSASPSPSPRPSNVNNGIQTGSAVIESPASFETGCSKPLDESESYAGGPAEAVGSPGDVKSLFKHPCQSPNEPIKHNDARRKQVTDLG